MTAEGLKSKATTGMLWSTVDRVVVNIGQLTLAIILARILSPRDFGLVAMLFVFITILEVFVSSGMGSALIQKQDTNDKDYSTVFVFNLFVSVFLYIILFISAPFIAKFYNSPQLLSLTRVIGVSIIINALSLVQRAYIQKTLDIKSIAKTNIFALLISGIVAILLALKGFGVWALAVQVLINSTVATISFYCFSTQKISFLFSKSSFNNLFGYSSKLLLSGLYAQFLQQVTSLAIGKYYLASQLGYYSQAKKLADSSAGTLSNILNTVTFPILSSLQKEPDRLLSAYKKMVKMTAFLSLPSMLLIAVMSESIIKLLLGNEWLETVPLLQWLALANALRPISVINMNILKAIGRSDLFLKVDLAKFPIIFLVLVFTLPVSVEAVAKGLFISSILSFFVETFMPGKIFYYGAIEQIKDIFKIIIATAIMVLSLYLILQLKLTPILNLIICIPMAIVVFIISSYFLKIEQLYDSFAILNKRFLRKS